MDTGQSDCGIVVSELSCYRGKSFAENPDMVMSRVCLGNFLMPVDDDQRDKCACPGDRYEH